MLTSPAFAGIELFAKNTFRQKAELLGCKLFSWPGVPNCWATPRSENCIELDKHGQYVCSATYSSVRPEAAIRAEHKTSEISTLSHTTDHDILVL